MIDWLVDWFLVRDSVHLFTVVQVGSGRSTCQQEVKVHQVRIVRSESGLVHTWNRMREAVVRPAFWLRSDPADEPMGFRSRRPACSHVAADAAKRANRHTHGADEPMGSLLSPPL